MAKSPATVLGWSSGGNIALALTAARPDLVRRLIVVEPPFHGLRRPRADQLRILARAKWAQLPRRPQEGGPSTSSTGLARSRTTKHRRRNATGCSAMPATSWRSSTRTRTA
ncbi:alpha/beta hydrolase [Streptomyces sp. 5K101]|uniref:alpha/beta hydrolase n=1 Tax=Streptomyces sp. 5K101 TaxID=3390037 RepID=UPI0039769962